MRVLLTDRAPVSHSVPHHPTPPDQLREQAGSQGSRGGCHLDLTILLPQPPKDWVNRPVSPHPAPISISPSSPLKRAGSLPLSIEEAGGSGTPGDRQSRALPWSHLGHAGGRRAPAAQLPAVCPSPPLSTQAELERRDSNGRPLAVTLRLSPFPLGIASLVQGDIQLVATLLPQLAAWTL